ncbi:MAG: glycerol kinase GlpK [Paracoccaceae bacterium]
MKHVLAIDQGTTSTRAIIFDEALNVVVSAQQEFQQHFPQPGWVEHAPADILQTTLATCKDVMSKTPGGGASVAGIGITNQRETTLVWDKETGEPVHNAIVWQDRRTADICEKLKADGLEPTVSERTGLLLDPYFSATKIKWVLDTVDGARDRAAKGKLLFGTVDSFLIWHLTGGKVHATDATNAARTMLYDIQAGAWDPELCRALDVPMQMLPQVLDSAGDFGTTDPAIFGAAIPILGVAGDQQAATIGQACFEPGMIKATFGTGCFVLLNTGSTIVRSDNRLLSTIAYQLDGQVTYALEGSIFIAGAVVQWLRDGLKIIDQAGQAETMALQADPAQPVYLVPAFTGLGAPYWDADCKGAIFGLSRNTGPAEISRAALESVGYQARDLLEAMDRDMPGLGGSTGLRVDGGMAASDWTMQFLADMVGISVDRPKVLESTARGAAWLAGWKAGIYPDQAGFAQTWNRERTFEPAMDANVRADKYAGWQDAVSRTLSR